MKQPVIIVEIQLLTAASQLMNCSTAEQRIHENSYYRKPEELDVMAEEYRRLSGLCYKSRPHFLEFTVSGINKGTARPELAELRDRSRAVVAIGGL